MVGIISTSRTRQECGITWRLTYVSQMTVPNFPHIDIEGHRYGGSCSEGLLAEGDYNCRQAMGGLSHRNGHLAKFYRYSEI